MGASARDASTIMALRLADGLSQFADVETYSFNIPDESVEHEVRQIGLIDVGQAQDLLLYHQSFGEPLMTQFLLSRPERLVVVYHNITPSGYFLDVAPHFALGLTWGRYELELLAPRSVLSIAISDFSAAELRDAGHRRVEVVPVGVDPRRLSEVPMNIELMRTLEEEFPNGFVLFVSQLLPHKRPDLMLGAVHLLRNALHLDVGLVMAGPMRMTDFSATVMMFAQALPDVRVRILGEVSDSELATVYRTCLCYLNPSDHEGFAVPPLEAMACGAPVVVRDCGAMGLTVGNGGLVLPSDWGPHEIAHSLAYLVGNADARSELRMRGYRRASDFDPEASVSRAVDLIMSAV